MKRISKIILATLLIPIGVIILYLFVITPVVRVFWQSSTKKESICILEDVDPVKEREHIYGPSSVTLFFTYPGDAWMAFRYCDSHHGGVFSSTIVRDSEGQWFESNYHFCALLRAYRGEYERQIAARENGIPDAIVSYRWCKDIHAVAFAQSLQAAREQLLKMGFSPMKK